jgi:hypothetical protein
MRNLVTGPFVKGLAGAVVGSLLILLAVHAYQDHMAMHQIRAFLEAHAAKIAKLP